MSANQATSDDRTASSGRFEPFDLTVHLGPDSIPWLSVSSRMGSVHGIPRRAASLPSLSDLLDHVYDYTDAVQFAERQPDPILSRILGELVFGDPMVLELFQATRGVTADRGRQVLFRILASPHLAVLPWELLPDPAAAHANHSHRYLALAPDTHLVRLARGLTYPARTALLEAPLNMLLVLSSPTPQNESEDWLAFDIFEVKRGLLAELSPLVEAGMLNIDVEDKPTLGNLRRRIGAQRRGYHLLHYVGHALPDRLIIEDSAGRRKDLDSSQFVDVLRLCPDLRLAVFAGCETARAAGDPATLDTRTAVGWRDLLSLADYCVQEASPAVIGMQAVLPFSTERVFTRFFYQALANGYSMAEALRLARGAIQGDERLGGGLLDWSVPALFLSSSEPNALLPRAAPIVKPAVHVRSDLKLGLRQSNERFFARELPLRQAVEIMAGLASERVLVITGAAGVGKTFLVDRALEELDDEFKKLYVHFDRLAPTVVQACGRIDAGLMPDLATLASLTPDHVLERMCRLVTERLRYGGGVTRAHDSAWTAEEWWDRLVEDMVQHRFVLAIDDIGLLDRTQHGLIEQLVGHWLVKYIDANYGATQKEDVLEFLQQQLSKLQESQERTDNQPQSVQYQLAPITSNLREALNGLPDRLLVEGQQVLSDLLERHVIALSYGVSRGTIGTAGDAIIPVGNGFTPSTVMAALNQLERVRETLGKALRVLAERRSPVRVVITTREKPQHLLDLLDEQVFEMRLAQLTWPETWRWIRRNLPALLSYGEDYLSRLWSRLGAKPSRWEELERRVLREHGKTVDLAELVKQIVPSTPTIPTRAGQRARRGERALRIAVAGPHLAGVQTLAEAITRLAFEHKIGGRVVLDAVESDALAALIEEPSPFRDNRTTTWAELLEWLGRVLMKQPDVILLDYGAYHDVQNIKKADFESPERALLRSIHYRSLLIAAGGNKENERGDNYASTPSVYPEVLSVGPLGDDFKLREYAEWHPTLGKPDLFMADDLATNALAAALKPELRSQPRGSSFSALHAVATATLVWSILPQYSPQAIRALLVAASNPVAGMEPARSLTMGDAIALARRRLVERTLKGGPASLQTLGAITGLDLQVLSATLDSLINLGQAVRLTSGRLERFQLGGSRHP